MSTPTRGKRGGRRGRSSVSFTQIRDALQFLAGLAVIGNEVWIVDDPRPLIVGLGAAMAGIPFARLGESRFLTRQDNEDESEQGGDEPPDR